MMKILVSPVGHRDPRSPNGEEGPALTICHYLQPDIVYLLPTAERPDVADSTFASSLKTRDEINGFLPNAEVFIKLLDIRDPTDFAQILPQVRDILARISKETESSGQREFYLNVSSATPQIQTASLLAVTSGLLPAKVLQVASPSYAPEEKRVRDTPITLLQEDAAVEKASHLYDRLMFDACVEELKSLERFTQSRPRRDAAQIWRLLCESYSALDRLNYTEAYQTISQVIEEVANTYDAQAISDILREQLSVLNQLSQGNLKENELTLSDIYHNARRRLIQVAYADALARVWRLLEGGMFYYLRENYGIEPGALEESLCLKPEATGSLSHNVIEKLRAEDKRYLSFESSRTMLKEDLCDEPFCSFLSRKTTLSGRQKEIGRIMEGLRQKRNNSVVAHGAKAVEAETAQTGLDLAEQFLNFLFPQLDLSQYPFAQEKLMAIGQSMRQMIQLK